jgi:sugar phosphate isomerase/epimerase
MAAELLKERGLTVSSLAFYLAGDSAELRRVGDIALALQVPVIGGGCRAEWLHEKRSEFLDFLKKNNLRFGFENHPEKSAAEVLEKIGDAEGGLIGVTIDTGWFGSQSYTAAQAIRELGSRLVHVHLKDIFPPSHGGDDRDIREGAPVTLKDIGHETCAYGEGCVGIEECVEALRETGYAGGISIEHEPEDHNPTAELVRSLELLKSWMAREEVRP